MLLSWGGAVSFSVLRPAGISLWYYLLWALAVISTRALGMTHDFWSVVLSALSLVSLLMETDDWSPSS